MTNIETGTAGERQQGDGMSQAVSEQATKATETGRRELQRQLEERTSQVGRQARSFAGALRRTGESMGSQPDQAGVERITADVADRIDRVGNYLEHARGDVVLDDAERFVRSRPWLVTGVAAAVGFAASRLLKASSESRHTASSSWPRPAAPTYAVGSASYAPAPESTMEPAWQPSGVA